MENNHHKECYKVIHKRRVLGRHHLANMVERFVRGNCQWSRGSSYITLLSDALLGLRFKLPWLAESYAAVHSVGKLSKLWCGAGRSVLSHMIQTDSQGGSTDTADAWSAASIQE